MSKVSVIMPCFNDGKFIMESIQSVLMSTYEDIELIIINDGSTDAKTINILHGLTDPRITVLNSMQLKPSGARNLGIQSSTGTYIFPVDADDIIMDTYIEKAVRILDSSEQVGIVYCYADMFGEQHGRWDLPNYSFDKMLVDNIIFVTAMFRKEDWRIAGGFNTKMQHGMEDYDFWLSILELDRQVVQIPEVLFRYRIKKSSRTTDFSSSREIVKDTYREIFFNHQHFFEKHYVQYAVGMREALIDQIYQYKAIRKYIPFIHIMLKSTWIKRVMKRILFGKKRSV